ncbi:MAG: NAD-binding protein [Methylotenera sp.]|uniref:potassium channel family protein n=1 Tax=Methylotenera sp. TaxID=2051956 RepID=UPI002489B94E|nr:potassium channel protein [Methylotenera sp.]MDI1309527.1 NAD-binding protein [Methylotenera sp.]
MNSILFLILRRLRRPIITIIVSFSIAIIGLTVMPGLDDQGKPWHMSIFQAFYVISYTATTIGFGEVPYPYSQAQRLWMTLSIYLTVIPWFYAIGKIITLIQDPSLRKIIISDRFASNVRLLQEPFYILCSYGETACLLAKALDNKGIRVVVIEPIQERLNELELRDTQNIILSLCADAKVPENLIQAGIHHPLCKGVVTLTDSDDVNLSVAIAVKLMNPDLPVLARAERQDIAANMASFGTDLIINPYTLFGDQLAMRVHAIGTYILQEWLTDVPGDTIPPPAFPPIGNWIVCGYGRFGKSVVQNLKQENITTTIIEANPQLTDCEICITGSGTEAITLLEAGVLDAVGIVAGTNNDINNLSIVMTAKELNPKLFVVARKNKRDNEVLFKKFNADITMQISDIIAHECLAHMVSPLLAQFLALTRNLSNQWANALISQLVEKVGEEVPETWGVTINAKNAPAVTELLNKSMHVQLENLTQDPHNRNQRLDVVALMIVRNQNSMLLPDANLRLAVDDCILFCGRPNAKFAMPLVLNNTKRLTFMIDGIEIFDSWIWRWLKQR